MSGACGSQQAASVLGSSVRSAALGGVARNPNSPPRLRGPPGQAGDQLIALFVSGRLSGALHRMRRGSFDVPHVGFVRCRTSGSENRATLIEGSKIRNRCRKPRARLLATRVAKSARRRPRRAQQAIEHQSLASVGETTQRGRDRRHDANDQSHKTDHWSLLADRDGRAWPSSTDASGVTRSQGRSSRTRRALKGSGAQHRNDAAWRRIRRRARLRERVSDPVGCLMAPVAGRVGCHSHWGVRCPLLAWFGSLRIALRSICRTLLPGVGVMIKFRPSELKGPAAGILPPSTFCSRFVDRTADSKAEAASVDVFATQRPGSATKE
jgi:hypothetical protein